MALESTITSGMMPLCSTAQKAPVRPTPVCTSSAISGMERSAVISRIRAQPGVRRGDHPALALDRFEDHPGGRGHTALGVVEQVLGPAGREFGAAFTADAERAAVVVRIGQAGHPSVAGRRRRRRGRPRSCRGRRR